MRKIVAIAGVPGTGKTTLMRKFMAAHQWERRSPAKLVETMYCKELDLHILGKYEDGEVFAGTDKLSMACQPEVSKWMAESKSNILYEGDRLTGTKFYDFMLSLPDADVQFLVLLAHKEVLQARYAERGSNQDETFLQGRATKINNLLTNFDYIDYLSEFFNNNENDQQVVLDRLNSIFQ